MMSAGRGLIHQLQIGGLLNEVHKVVGQRDENFINLPGGKVGYHLLMTKIAMEITIFNKLINGKLINAP